MSTKPSDCKARRASRTTGRLTPNWAASSISLGSASPERKRPLMICSLSVWTTCWYRLGTWLIFLSTPGMPSSPWPKYYNRAPASRVRSARRGAPCSLGDKYPLTDDSASLYIMLNILQLVGAGFQPGKRFPKK